jgi:hypothetical protein
MDIGALGNSRTLREPRDGVSKMDSRGHHASPDQ